MFPSKMTGKGLNFITNILTMPKEHHVGQGTRGMNKHRNLLSKQICKK